MSLRKPRTPHALQGFVSSFKAGERCSQEDLLWAPEQLCSTKLERLLCSSRDTWGWKRNLKPYGLRKVSVCFAICATETQSLRTCCLCSYRLFLKTQERFLQTEQGAGMRAETLFGLWDTLAWLKILLRQKAQGAEHKIHHCCSVWCCRCCCSLVMWTVVLLFTGDGPWFCKQHCFEVLTNGTLRTCCSWRGYATWIWDYTTAQFVKQCVPI